MKKLVAVIATLFAAVIGLILWLSYLEEKQWQEFIKEGDCVLEGVKASEVIPVTTTGIDSKGNVVTTTSTMYVPGKEYWYCPRSDSTYTRTK